MSHQNRTLYGNASTVGVMCGAPWSRRVWYGAGRGPLHTLVIFILLDTLHCPITSALKDTDSMPEPVSMTMDVIHGAAILDVSYFVFNSDHDKFYLESKADEFYGYYSVAGRTGDGQGKPIQIHPLTCDSQVDEHTPRPWVAIIILERPNVTAASECGQIYSQTLRAQQDGASAVVLGIHNNKVAAKQLSMYTDTFSVPIMLVEGSQSKRLRQIIINSLNSSNVYIRPGLPIRKGSEKSPTKLMIIVGMVLFLVLLCGVSGLLIKFKCYSTRQPSMSDVAKGILSKMGTRKFAFLDTSSDSDMDTCAVCLEDYKEGQELRTLPCGHEFHKVCVDPWLIASRTCPFCMYNITENHLETGGTLCLSENQRPSTGPQIGHMTSAPSRGGRQGEYGHYYSPLTNVASLPGYPYHSANGREQSPYHQIFVSPIDNLVPVHTSCVTGPQRHPGSNIYFQPYSNQDPQGGLQYSDVSGQYFSYNVVALTPAASKPSEQVPPKPTSPVQCGVHPLASESVHKTPSHKVARNKGIYSASNNRRRPPGRHKVTSSSSHAKCRPDLSTRIHLHKQSQHRRPPDIPNSSSESEYEVRLNRSALSRTRLHHYASSHFDADVSETSTGGPSGMDSDGPGLESGSSHLDLSNKSVFGSSDVPSDISSCDLNVYCRDKETPDSLSRYRHRDPSTCAISELAPGVHLRPACMTDNNRKSAISRKRQTSNSKSVPYSVITPSKGGRSTRTLFSGKGYVHPPASLEESDQTISSVGTSEISPHVSGWSQSGESDTNLRQPPDSTQKVPRVYPAPTSKTAVCPLCHGNTSAKSNYGTTVERSDPSTRPLLAPELPSVQAYCSEEAQGGPPPAGPGGALHPVSPSDFEPKKSSGFGNSYPQTGGDSQVRPVLLSHPLPHPAVQRHPLLQNPGPLPYDWDAFHLLTPRLTSESLAQVPRETVSKAGSTCSFYCYPSNQQSSSASSSPTHHHKSPETLTDVGGPRTVIIQSSRAGDTTTSSMPSSPLLPANIV